MTLPNVFRTLTLLERIVLSIGTGVMLLVIVLLMLVLFEPPNLRYTNLPFPVCRTTDLITEAGPPGLTGAETCIPKLLTEGIRVEDSPALLVMRCVDDPFADNSEGLSYSFERDLVSSTGSLRIAMPSGSSATPAGCSTVISKLNQLPLGTPSGVYHIEGRSQVRGRLRLATVRWSTQDFRVVAP